MITSGLKISRMLDAYPETLDIMLNASSHFSKLKNKLLRKALAGRVTVEQAASIAGVPLYDLLFNLNSVIGKEEEFTSAFDSKIAINSETGPAGAMPRFLSDLTGDKITALDVRKDIGNGSDPLKKILAAAKQIKEDKVLMLINSFEPVPLYSVLKRKGLDHWTERKDSEWRVYFFKSGRDKKGTDEKEFNPSCPVITGEEKIIETDVRELEPPGPMIKVLEILSDFDDDTVLLVHHHREPLMLYPKLEERGFGAVANKINDNYYKILIKRKTGGHAV